MNSKSRNQSISNCHDMIMTKKRKASFMIRVNCYASKKSCCNWFINSTLQDEDYRGFIKKI